MSELIGKPDWSCTIADEAENIKKTMPSPYIELTNQKQLKMNDDDDNDDDDDDYWEEEKDKDSDNITILEPVSHQKTHYRSTPLETQKGERERERERERE